MPTLTLQTLASSAPSQMLEIMGCGLASGPKGTPSNGFIIYVFGTVGLVDSEGSEAVADVWCCLV